MAKRHIFFAACCLALLLLPSVSSRASDAWWNRISATDGGLAGKADHGAPLWTLSGGRAIERGHAADAHTPGDVSLIAGSPADPGVAVAAGTGGIWRRDAAGGWSRSLILLPQSLVSGPPRVTAIVAFDQPVSVSIYVATDGYGILLTNDGGQSWIRDDLGLPDHVRALATNAVQRDLYAATDSGTWVHHLSRIPSPPAYAQSDLLWRWLVVVLISLGVAAGSVVVLRVVMPVRVVNGPADLGQ